jgi:hypothetical protein
MESVARDFFQRAAQTTEIRWLHELSRLNNRVSENNHADASRLAAVIEGLEAQLSAMGTINNNKLKLRLREFLIA